VWYIVPPNNKWLYFGFVCHSFPFGCSVAGGSPTTKLKNIILKEASHSAYAYKIPRFLNLSIADTTLFFIFLTQLLPLG